MKLNFSITKTKVRADQAFWFAWIFLIWSSETVTSIPFFEYYYKYPVRPETRTLAIQTFIASAIGFLIGSLLYKSASGVTKSVGFEVGIVKFATRWQGWAAILIFTVGLIEFVVNQNKFSNLLDLRRSAVGGDLQTATFFTQFFLFSQAFTMLVGFSDGYKAKNSRGVIALIIGGLVLHNLAVGGRINIVVTPLLYMIPFVLSACQRGDWTSTVKYRSKRFSLMLVALVITLFSVVRLLRSDYVDIAVLTSLEGIMMNVLFAIPMYVSDTFISVAVHVGHARASEVPFGYFTFDAMYRLFGSIFPLDLQDSNTVFGHAYYRHTPDPWAWTQTNLIPRLVADFGSQFWLALVPISAVVQWLSLYRMRIKFLSIVIRSLMVFSSAYTILAASWFTSLNVYIIFYSFLLYFLAHKSPLNGGIYVAGRLGRRRFVG